MKNIILLFFLALTASAVAQQKTDTDGCLIFEMPEEDTVYVMKQYYMVFYKSGPNRDQDSATAAQIQKGHMGAINGWADGGKLSMAGPFGDDTALRGILIFNVPKKETVEKLMEQDPAIKSGRLIFEIHPWWGAKGSKLK